jgi:hypothetical protein
MELKGDHQELLTLYWDMGVIKVIMTETILKQAELIADEITKGK